MRTLFLPRPMFCPPIFALLSRLCCRVNLENHSCAATARREEAQPRVALVAVSGMKSGGWVGQIQGQEQGKKAHGGTK